MNKNHEYIQARLIIDVGITVDPDFFNFNFAENIGIFNPKDKPDYKRANEIVDKYLLNYPREIKTNNKNKQKLSIFEKYVMVKLKILLAQGFDDELNTKKVFNYFWKAFDERNRDPKAGYYLSDERF